MIESQNGRSALLRISISGSAGEGVLSAGDLLQNALSGMGYWTSIYKAFPSTIQGSDCSVLINVASEPFTAPRSQTDISVCLIKQTITVDHHLLDLSDPSRIPAHQDHLVELEIPFQSCVHTVKRSPLRSSYALGVIAWMLGIPCGSILELLSSKISAKRIKLRAQNREALEEGYAYARQGVPFVKGSMFPRCTSSDEERVLLNGNEAIALGALAAGCRFYASYPITPATSIGDYLGKHMASFGGVAYQAEDEIAALGAVIGASFNGVRAMTATSGPGLSLMQEFIGYASITETPAVIIDVQRPGPSTGMPTRHAQEDLLAAAFGGHGEGERIVLAAVDVEDCFYLTSEAFDLAERFRCPVIVLSDGALACMGQTIQKPDLNRFAQMETDSEVSSKRSIHNFTDNSEWSPEPVRVPGVSVVSRRITGVEHDSRHLPTNDPSVRTSQVERRAAKIIALKEETDHLFELDDGGLSENQAELSVMAWGLTAAVTAQAVKELRSRGRRVAALYPRMLFPVVTAQIEKLTKYSGNLVVVESNYTAQFTKLIRMHIAYPVQSVTQARGEPFTLEELTSLLEGFADVCRTAGEMNR